NALSATPAPASSVVAPGGSRSRRPNPCQPSLKGVVMSVIKPRVRGKHLVEHRTRLDQENHETLYAYAAFVDEDTDYIVNQLVETVLAKDKEFVAWRAAHPQSYAPRPFSRPQPPRRHATARA